MNTNIVIESFNKDEQVVNVIKPEYGGNCDLSTLLTFLRENKEKINELLLSNGALLFRGFAINTREEFLQVKETYAGVSHFNYVDGNSPRTKLTTAIYTSTEYPQEYSISLHNEMSYSNKWPNVLFFYCFIPAEEGGETPIVDCRYILKKFNPDLVSNFEEKGVKYTRYLSGSTGVGKSWMDTFETNDKAVIEQYCQENNIEYFWEGDAIFLSQQGYGIAIHPATQEKVWFNQANQFHPSGLPEEIYKGLKLMHARKKHRFPQYAFYGNGEEISEQYLKEITDLQFDHAIKFKWEKGDVLMLDNMLMAHGRMPFKGDRKIYVSMC